MKTIIEFDYEAMIATMTTGDSSVTLDMASFQIDKEFTEEVLPDCTDIDAPGWIKHVDTGRRTIIIKGIQCSK